MNELEDKKNNYKLYSEMAISTAVFFGGPLAAGILISKNFKSINKYDAAKKAMFWGIWGMLGLLIILSILPNNIIDKSPSTLIPLIYTAIISSLVSKHQGPFIKKHKENGGKFYSGWKAAGIGFICAILSIGVFLLTFSFKPAFPGEKAVYGKKNHEIYYSEDISKEDIDATADYLTKIGIFPNTHKVIIQIIKKDDSYTVRLPILKDFWDDFGVLNELKLIRLDLQNNVLKKHTKLILFHDEFTGVVEKEILGKPLNSSIINQEVFNGFDTNDKKTKVVKTSYNDVHIGIILTYSIKEGTSILDSISNGISFEEAAKKFSKGPNAEVGGDIGFINPADLGIAIQKVIAKLKDEEISPLVKGENGYLIIKRYSD